MYAVQEHTNSDAGGVLAKDILSAYPLEVTQVASELYFDRVSVLGQDVFKVKWGYEAASRWLEKQIWDNAAERWEEFVKALDERYLGFFPPLSYEDARIADYWKTRNDLKWFGVEAEGFGWNILRIIDDIVAVGWALDLAFGYRPFGAEGIDSQRTLIHKKAFEALKAHAEVPPDAHRTGIKLWKFFSEFEPAESDIVDLMKECGVGLEEVRSQVAKFYDLGITTAFRESQYPPFMVVEKMKKRYDEAVRELLSPMEQWLMRKEPSPAEPEPVPGPEPLIQS